MTTIANTKNWATDARRRLAETRGKKPETKAGQIWALWPEIKLAIADGQRVATICRFLCDEVGIQITPGVLTTYMGRCRRREMSGRVQSNAAIPSGNVDPHNVDDLMATAREALSKPRFDIRKLHADGDPTGQNLI